MNSRVHNFAAGPAALPESVLQEARDELLVYKGLGASILYWFDRYVQHQVERTFGGR